MKWLFLHKAQTGVNNYYNLIQLKILFISTKFTPLSLLSFLPLFLLSLSFSLSCSLSANAVKNYNQIWFPFHTKDIQNHNLFMALEIFVLWFTYHASIHTALVSFWSVVSHYHTEININFFLCKKNIQLFLSWKKTYK